MNFITNLKTSLWVGFCFTTCVLISCKDEESEVGLSIQQSGQQYAIGNDSLAKINAFTYQQKDTIYLKPERTSLGAMFDERFGWFQNNFMTEVKPVYHSKFYSNPDSSVSIADSLKLHLTIQGNYGKGGTEQTIKMYQLRLDNPLKGIDSMPNNNEIISQFYDEDKLVKTFTFIPDSVNDILTIDMPEELMNQLMVNTIDSSNVDEIFKSNILRGFYFVAEELNEGGAISYININDTSYLELYFHNPEDTNVLTQKYVFDSFRDRCNIFKRTYSDNITYLLPETKPDTNNEDELIYIRENDALEGRIFISELNSWADSGFVIINKAYLELFVDYDSITSSDYPPNSYLLVTFDTYFDDYPVPSQENMPLPDLASSANYVPYNKDNNSYIIPLTLTMNDFLQDSVYNFNINITTPGHKSNLSSAARAILMGPKHPEKPAKLHITYTRLNQ